MTSPLPAAWVEALDDFVPPEMFDNRVYAPFIRPFFGGGPCPPSAYGSTRIHHWFGTAGRRRQPEDGAWYEVKVHDPPLSAPLKVLFNPHAFAEFEFEKFGTDPRREPQFSWGLPNYGEILARKGDRCEICFEAWSGTCVADSPGRPVAHTSPV